ncbi:MAG: Rid family detoxifying hydrolase [Tissierellia bacterium]|nr:Rid family detoxifying hydrolase [Tissierellia bacterium]
MALEFLLTEKAPAAIGPYSQGTKGAGVLFVSGQLPINPATGELVTDSVEKAAKTSLNNVLAIVEAGGGTLESIAKVNVYVKDMNDFGAINGVYTEFFGEHKPARALVEVSRLPKDALIEIEAIAIV